MARSIKKEEPLEESIDSEIVITPESDEIVFLRKLMQIQEDGGWGRHLHSVINERINQLKGE